MAGNYKNRQTQITSDNARLSITQSQTDSTIPASGEMDFVTYVLETFIASGDAFEISADGGSNYTLMNSTQAVASFTATVGNSVSIPGIGNSNGRYRIVADGTAGTRVVMQSTITLAEG